MKKEDLDEYWRYWAEMSFELVTVDNIEELNQEIYNAYETLDVNGTWSVRDYDELRPVWLEYVKELLRMGYTPERLKHELFQQFMFSTM